METLVAVAHHRNHHHYHYDGRIRRHGPAKFRSFGSTPADNFSGINCRSFQSVAGLLPTPLKSCYSTTPNESFAVSPRTPSPSVNKNHKSLKRCSSSMTPTPIELDFENKDEDLHLYERWAGPAYSNSPPPSSLPMPKFSMRPKRSVSLDLPDSTSKFDFHLISKSAPASPTREHIGDLFDSSDSATRTLRRILNLDITDE